MPSPPLEIRPLVVSGSPENRVDLVFFSDGCECAIFISDVRASVLRVTLSIDTVNETDKFFADAKQLADDVSKNQTFYTVKPLLNFWGAFTPSEEVDIFCISWPLYADIPS